MRYQYEVRNFKGDISCSGAGPTKSAKDGMETVMGTAIRWANEEQEYKNWKTITVWIDQEEGA